MKPATTRTLNPLPFQDLEPHRFEDLVRQLAYDLRQWRSLEATGRAGSDGGIDIRGVEVVPVGDRPEGDWPEDQTDEPACADRVWVFQCKREKALARRDVHETVQDSLGPAAMPPPHGFVLAIACDVSKKTRDVFREHMVLRGVEEFALWAKGELEDMLFQPKNDRLLFAYFGLSLQPRRRSIATQLRSEIARKKQLMGLLEGAGAEGKLMLLRDPSDERYPHEPAEYDPPARWFACHVITAMKPGHLVVLRHEYLAATTPDGGHWDAILDCDLAETSVEADLQAAGARDRSGHDRDERPSRAFWNEYIPEAERAYLKMTRYVAFTRILAIDPIGDGYYPIPHLFVEFDSANGPFAAETFAFLQRATIPGQRLDLTPEEAGRTRIFPPFSPGQFDPPPLGFDDTSEVAGPLSGPVEERLRSLFPEATEAVAPRSARAEAAVAEPAGDKMRLFREWRDNIALPLLSAFALRLRALGHSARVVVRSVERGGLSGEAFESIELRVQVHRATSYNPSYCAPGHVHVSLSVNGLWRLEALPTASQSRGGYFEPAPPRVDAMSKERLEALVVQMLERLEAGA